MILRKVTQCGNWSILNKTGKAGLKRPLVLQVGGMDLQWGILNEVWICNHSLEQACLDHLINNTLVLCLWNMQVESNLQINALKNILKLRGYLILGVSVFIFVRFLSYFVTVATNSIKPYGKLSFGGGCFLSCWRKKMIKRVSKMGSNQHVCK